MVGALFLGILGWLVGSFVDLCVCERERFYFFSFSQKFSNDQECDNNFYGLQKEFMGIRNRNSIGRFCWHAEKLNYSVWMSRNRHILGRECHIMV